MTEIVAERHPIAPLFLVGESMGGAVAMAALSAPDGGPLRERVAGTVLIAPAVWSRDTMAGHERAALWFFTTFLPWLPVTGEGLDIQASDNIEMLLALGRDPLVLKENRIDAVAGLVDLMDAGFAAAPGLPSPALVLFGEREELDPPRRHHRHLGPAAGRRCRGDRTGTPAWSSPSIPRAGTCCCAISTAGS